MDYDDLYIVGIGASAGGFETLQKFLQYINNNNRLSYVIVQHLDPKQRTLLGELLGKYTKLKIQAISNEEKIKENRIYYCPPNKNVLIEKGKFILEVPEQAICPKPSINKFFESLAKEKKNKAIGVIFSGTGSDGAKGIVKITKNGGLALTENEEAKYYAMPKASIDTGVVTASLPAEALAEGICLFLDDNKYFDKHFEIQDSVERILNLLNKKTGVDFSSYKEATVTRRIKKRVNETRSSGILDYIKLLEKNNSEIEKLKDELLIIVTSFFRDSDAFNALKIELEKLVLNKKNDNLRVWIPACATGEEAYSIAITISELIKKYKLKLEVTIFASDISEKTIKKTRNRFFTSEQLEHVKPNLIEEYFEYVDEIYKPVRDLREMIVFSKHDIIKDPPFLNLDLISCRNLLIYFDLELQKRVLSIFYYVLKFNGLLFLGQSETIGNLSYLFSIINNKYKIYKKTSNMDNIDINLLSYVHKNKYIKKDFKDKKIDINSNEIDFLVTKAISLKYAQNGVVIDSSNRILYFMGNCSEYINHPQGVQTSDIFKLVADYLKLDLRVIVNESRKHKKFFNSKKVRIVNSGKVTGYLNIYVFPLEKNKLGDDTLFISFEKEIEKNLILVNEVDHLSNSDEIGVLEDELSDLKERLHVTIEELQTTNEELQSTNEELQSTNEELETSNEELQSSNEELQTVNDELIFSNLELDFANKAFNNVLSSIDSYVIILDEKLNIIKFTDGITKFFNISKSEDINFSNIILNSRIDLPNILKDIKDCISHDKNVGYEVHFGTRHYWFSIKKIDIGTSKSTGIDEGIILSFIDKTEIFKKDQLLFQQSKMASMGEMLGNIAHQWRQPLNNLGLSTSNFLDKLENDILQKEDIEKFKTKYKDSILALNETIDDFKNFYDSNDEKVELDINQSIDQALRMIDDSFKFNNIKVEINKTYGLYYLSRKNELSQVFVNILSNSKDAFVLRNIKNRKIIITTKKVNNNIEINFLDNAGGVEKRDLKYLTKSYFTTKKSIGGTGIGLYMSEMILRHLEGYIDFKNEDYGLLVRVVIPISKDMNVK